MPPTRRSFVAPLADLDFNMLVPEGFAQPPLPERTPDFDNPAFTAALTLLSSPVAMALLTVSARPAYADGSVIDWARFLCDQNNITLTGLMPGRIGGAAGWHPAILAQGRSVQQEANLQLRIAIFEDGGRLVIIQGMCPEELAPSYLSTLEQSVMSLEIARPKGPTVPLVPDAPVPAYQPIQSEAK